MEEISDFRKELKLTMPLLVGGTGEDSVGKKFGVVVNPTNYVLDKDGKVVAQSSAAIWRRLEPRSPSLGFKRSRRRSPLNLRDALMGVPLSFWIAV